MNDISYWKRIYLLHSKSNTFKKKINSANKILNEFFDLNIKFYGSISGGKDSICMMDLMFKLNNDCKFVSEKDDLDFPNELDYIKSFINNGYDIEIITPPVKLWDVLCNHNFCEDIHSKGTKFSDDYFYSILKTHQIENKYKGVCLGLRTQESKGRLHNFKNNGYIYYNKTGDQMICQPLANWTATDIFAYLFSNNIPILDIYFKTKFVKSPEDIRKAWILPSSQSSSGQAIWLKYYYPELYSKLTMINPIIKTYV